MRSEDEEEAIACAGVSLRFREKLSAFAKKVIKILLYKSSPYEIFYDSTSGLIVVLRAHLERVLMRLCSLRIVAFTALREAHLLRPLASVRFY